MDTQLERLFTIYIIVSILIIVSIIIRVTKNDDIHFLKKKVIRNCDYWCVSHFVVYLLLGYFSPKFWYISFTLSILWEVIEYLLQQYPNIYIKSNGMVDIQTNTFGLVIGMILKSFVDTYI